MRVELTEDRGKLADRLLRITGENAMLCYQCKKCTLGCPSAYAMSMNPHELMRALQLGLEDEVFWSGTIWICLSCETCNTRCPQGINILKLIDGLRTSSFKREYYNPVPELPMMHRLFLKLARRFGRIYELGLVLILNLKMVNPLKDIDMAMPMFKRGRLRIFPHRSEGVRELRQVISRLEAMEEEE
ncbi:MAG: 4Fe-4S dicluster domain-containing protein [Proteobacteria bacterium]|nr:4Fe-4S dicluster domain-containing protein [Pseudomonadota bacterium]